MKIHFKDIGLKKFTKTVEITGWDGFHDIIEYLGAEVDMHLPEMGEFEFVPTDGQPHLLANKYVVVHEDVSGVTRGMGIITIDLSTSI